MVMVMVIMPVERKTAVMMGMDVTMILIGMMTTITVMLM